MKKNTKLLKVGAFLVALTMLLGSFPGRYNVTIAYSEGETEVTDDPAAAEAAQQAAEEAARLAEEEAARKAAEEAAAAEAARLAEEEAARKAAEEEAARKAAEEAAARQAAEEEAARKAAEEEAARKAAEEEAARKAAEEEAARKAAEEAAKQEVTPEPEPAPTEEYSDEISGEPAPELEPDDEDDWDDEDWDDEDWDDEDEDDDEGETMILDDWDAGSISEDLLDRFNDTSNFEHMEYSGTADIELKNDGTLHYGDQVKLEAKVHDVNLSYRLIWEANDNDDRGWYTVASGEEYNFTLTADNLDREYRVVLFSID